MRVKAIGNVHFFGLQCMKAKASVTIDSTKSRHAILCFRWGSPFNIFHHFLLNPLPFLWMLKVQSQPKTPPQFIIDEFHICFNMVQNGKENKVVCANIYISSSDVNDLSLPTPTTLAAFQEMTVYFIFFQEIIHFDMSCYVIVC